MAGADSHGNNYGFCRSLCRNARTGGNVILTELFH